MTDNLDVTALVTLHISSIMIGFQKRIMSVDWMSACQISGSVLPLAFAGSFGRCYRGNGCLVKSGRHFVNVVDGEEREYQTGKRERGGDSQHLQV